jgi:hypothetical protein
MRAGENVGRESGSLESGAKEGAGRAFAVGAGNMKYRRHCVLRIAEPVEEQRDSLKAQPVAGGRQESEAIQLGLDGRIVRPREIGHQAAAFSGIR